VTSLDISSEPADNIEQFKRIWMSGGQAALDNYVYQLLERMSGASGPDSVDRFADQFWDYVWHQIGGRITNDPTVQMMVGFGATVIWQQNRIKAEIEERTKFIAFFEEQARKYTRDVLIESEKRMRGELKHYGLGFPDDPSSLYTWAMDANTARRALGIAAAGLARRRNALIKANSDFRNMVWAVTYSEPVEEAQRQADRDYEVFRLQVIPRFPVLEEISSIEIHPFYDQDAEPDDTQGEKLNMLAQMAQGGSSKEATDYIIDTVFEKLRNIDKVREELKPGGEINIWRLPEIVQATRKLTGAASGTVEGEVVQHKFALENKPPNESESLLGKILLYAGLVLGPFTDFISLAPYTIYKGGKVASAIYGHYKEYMLQKALHGTDFGALAISAEDPSLFWLAGDILSAGFVILDLATMAAPAARIFRRLAPLARLAREVQAGEEVLSALKNRAAELASKELGVGAREAGEFADKVVADAQARSGGMVGMTAEEAKMLEQADAQAAGTRTASTPVDVTKRGVSPPATKVEGTEQKIGSLGKMTDETRALLRDPKNEDMLDALAEHPRASRVLKHCSKYCYPEIEGDLVKKLDEVLERAERYGHYNPEELNEFLYKNRENLEQAIEYLDDLVLEYEAKFAKRGAAGNPLADTSGFPRYMSGENLIIKSEPYRKIIGDLGENAGEWLLESNGWEIKIKIRNISDNGIDIFAVHTETGRVGFFEVKTSSIGVIPELSPRQTNMRDFVATVLEEAIAGRGQWMSLDPDTLSVVRELLQTFRSSAGNVSGGVIGIDLKNKTMRLSAWL
jgi:hypothetical protein